MPQPTRRQIRASISRIGGYDRDWSLVETSEGTFYIHNSDYDSFANSIGWSARFPDYDGRAITLWIEDDVIVGWA